MNDDETSLKTSSFLSYSFKYSCPRWFSYNLRPTSLFFFFHFILPFHSDKCYLYTASIILLGDVLGAGHSVPREVNNHNNNNNSRPSLKKKKKKKSKKCKSACSAVVPAGGWAPSSSSTDNKFHSPSRCPAPLRIIFCRHSNWPTRIVSHLEIEKRERETGHEDSGGDGGAGIIYHVTSAARRRTNFVLFFYET